MWLLRLAAPTTALPVIRGEAEAAQLERTIIKLAKDRKIIGNTKERGIWELGLDTVAIPLIL